MNSHPCYSTILRKATRRLDARYDAALAPWGISIAQYSLLRAILRAGVASLTQIGRVQELDRSTVGRNIKVLIRDGLVEAAQAEDHRLSAVRLTEAGLRTVSEAKLRWDEVQAEVDALLGPDGVQGLIDQVRRL